MVTGLAFLRAQEPRKENYYSQNAQRAPGLESCSLSPASSLRRLASSVNFSSHIGELSGEVNYYIAFGFL